VSSESKEGGSAYRPIGNRDEPVNDPFGMMDAPGTLYVVATPLGNLEDLSPRAVRVLRECDLIAAEDTRRSATLLRAHTIATPTISYFEHNENVRTAQIVRALEEGKSVALVTDAGTPGISDPGFRLVREARQKGLPVVPVPGPSAAITALSVSGLPTDRFLFAGFLPARSSQRQKALTALAAVEATLVVYESPLRVLACLTDMQAILGDRNAFLCREATKLHEEYRPGRLSEIRSALLGRPSVKGEIVLCVEGAQEPIADEAEPLDRLYARLVAEGRTRREAVKEAARRLGLPAREVYAKVQALEEGAE
jgi:16S rRNA (cytidine1402-2'-O)-methyltransferase